MNIFYKDLFDFVFGIIVFLLLLPFMIIIGIGIKLTSRGPIFYKQKRVGKDGKLFDIYKFRTMKTDADKTGPEITIGKDPRITGIGHFLRKYKLDEFAQIINILKGEMSFVGPRPEVPGYVKYYTEEQRRVLTVKPGVTDLASIKYKDENELLGKSDNPEETYIKVIMPEKLRINLEYIDNISLSYDFKMIFNTVKEVFFNR